MMEHIVHDSDINGFWHCGSHIPRESEFLKLKRGLKIRNDGCASAISRILMPGPNDHDIPSCAVSVTPDANGARVEWDKVDPTKVAYCIIEFCCDEDSNLCSDRYESSRDGRKIVRIRLTKKNDCTKSSSIDFAINVANRFPGKTVLWASLPCTWGCPWSKVNRATCTNHAHRQHQLWIEHVLLAKQFERLADVVKANGDLIAWEWPRFNDLWARRPAQRIMRKYDLKPVNFDGCKV